MRKKFELQKKFVFATILCVLTCSGSRADLIFLPESTHQQFETYGLWIDQQSTLVYKSGGRAWGAIGGAISLFGEKNWKWTPELVLNGSANAAFRINQNISSLLTETDDARVGLSLDFHFEDDFRARLGWTHQSGHISDNLEDLDLFGENLGNEILSFRLVKDLEYKLRFGGSLRAVVSSDPGMKVFGSEQFFEWFLWGATQNTHRFYPYLALGLEEYGRQQIDLSWHIQIGAVAGNHFLAQKHSSLRVVMGFYSGNDPRLKYFQFKNAKTHFGYFGFMFDL